MSSAAAKTVLHGDQPLVVTFRNVTESGFLFKANPYTAGLPLLQSGPGPVVTPKPSRCYWRTGSLPNGMAIAKQRPDCNLSARAGWLGAVHERIVSARTDKDQSFIRRIAMKKYVKPSLVGLGLLRLVTKYSYCDFQPIYRPE